jgi:uncharacterized membrane protein
MSEKPPAWKPLAGLLASAGVLHFATPKQFEAIVPTALGDPKPWVRLSGAIELACAVGLALPRTRRFAGLASAGLFVGVFPANVEMAVRGVRSPKASAATKAALIGRLPLQLPLVLRSLRLARAK